MIHQTTDALVWQVSPYSETTLLVRLLTRECGVVRAMARGARRGGGRATQAAFEPMAWVHVRLRRPERGDGLATTDEVALNEDWPWLRRDVTRQAWAALGVEALGELAVVSPVDPYCFDEACRFLQALRDARGAGSLAIALLARMLHEAGFPVSLPSASPPDPMPEKWTYHFEEMAFVPAGDGVDSVGSMRLPGPVVAALWGALAVPPPLDDGFALAAPLGPTALRWLVRVWEDHLHRRFKSMRFLEEMVLRAPREDIRQKAKGIRQKA